jgi:sarcosine oxidase subunit gamma
VSEFELDAGTIGARTPGHYGVAATDVTLAETSFAAAWNMQGDPARAPFLAEVRRLFDVDLPLIPNTTARGAAWTAFWLGPSSWLLVARANAKLQLDAFTAQRDALNGAGGALFDLSASRVAFEIGGKRGATVLAKGCPLDFHSRAFPAGTCAQSLLGHISALIWRSDETPAFTVMVARSLARDAWRALCVSAAQYGYDVYSLPANSRFDFLLLPFRYDRPQATDGHHQSRRSPQLLTAWRQPGFPG